MNEDGVGITIPHDNQPENTQAETPAASDTANFGDPEPSFNGPIDSSPEDTPVLPQAAPLTPNIPTNRSSNAFNSTQDLKQDNSKVPDFFNNAIATAKASNEQTKRRNRKLFFTIGLVIGVIAIIAIIILVVIPFISNSILNQKLSANNKEIRVVFNEYANYVLNGTESTDEIGEYDPGKNYNLIAIYRRGDAKELAAFYRKADEKYKKVSEKDERIIFGGRLGQYKYYDMHKVLEEALKCANEYIK
jgi:competence protein ComGC